jgi:hypothetical protein
MYILYFTPGAPLSGSKANHQHKRKNQNKGSRLEDKKFVRHVFKRTSTHVRPVATDLGSSSERNWRGAGKLGLRYQAGWEDA